MIKDLNSKKLIFLLLIILGCLGGLGIGKYLYSDPEKQSPQPADTKKEEIETREIYYIETGEIYPDWKKLTVRGVYSIEYPLESSLILTNDGTGVGIALKGYGGVDFRISADGGDLRLRDWVGKYRPETKRRVIKEWDSVVGGKKAYSFAVSGPAGEYRYTFISTDQKVLEMELGGYLPVPETESLKRDKETLFKIFDTLRLLD